MSSERSNPPLVADPRWPQDEPEASLDAWRTIAAASLRGRPLSALTTVTIDGLELPPLFTAHDAVAERALPGASPFTRGSAAGSSGWESCQELPGPGLGEARRAMCEEIAQGVSSFLLRPHTTDQDAAGDRKAAAGTQWSTAAQLQELLEASAGQQPRIHLAAGADLAAAAQLASCGREGAPAAASWRLGIDPLAELAATGTLPYSLERGLELAADAAAWCRNTQWTAAPLSVSSLPYHEAGATVIEEIGIALATGVEYLRALAKAGISLTDRPAPFVFVQSAGRDFFTEIARLRSLRTLWALVMEHCGAEPPARRITIHSISSERMLSRRDPWVNLLRVTVSTAAAVIGGADIIGSLGFDRAIRPADRHSRRLAATTQSILREESHLGRVADPAGGSWYVEQLTEMVNEKAWQLFQELEAAGGMAAALRSGIVQERLAASQARRREWIARRKLPLTGVSSFPNLREEKLPVAPQRTSAASETGRHAASEVAELQYLGELARTPAPTPGQLFEAAVAAARTGVDRRQLLELLSGDSSPASCPALPRRRDAEDFEVLRDTSDQMLLASGTRPRAFLANLGPLSEHKARSEFAANFLGAAGIEAVSSAGCSGPDEAAASFRESGCSLAVICSSNRVYAELAAQAAAALKSAGASALVLAGAPGDAEEVWRRAGIDHFIFMGCDILAILNTLMARLGGDDD